MIKAVVLDFDGVVVDSNEIKYGAFFDLFAADGGASAVVRDVLARYRAASRFEILREILARLGKSAGEIEALVPAYAREYNARVQRAILEIGLDAEMKTALADLHGDYPLYLNSATYAPALFESVANLGIADFFRRICGRPPSKQDNLREILAGEAIDGAQAVVVGDGEDDYEAARALGCRFLGFANRFNDWRPGTIPLVPHAAELPRWVRSLDQARS